jgi:hypothetical protein
MEPSGPIRCLRITQTCSKSALQRCSIWTTRSRCNCCGGGPRAAVPSRECPAYRQIYPLVAVRVAHLGSG